ncbi:hypothetical protein Skr01_64980 [Sphaerisporangium krabiense]|uniref:Gram-positive cocci surface proteins LPxTG domain-containing protein n=1 Tax=Sphaerisporangium krabiense TaxID=763782 RepID=A0A7W8Z0H1_9ACTN|nr:hypothetical protein [Sphaerisporangium krabiense]MBB5624885.1 hypothetical protein [Sphaerisporangium krabiense]GII66413.1 hypothetical protein Skr01_64980 [Sphaerisporangium krabiense]
MHRVGRVAVSGAFLLLGGVACTASAQTGGTADPTPAPTLSRQDIRVQIVPSKVQSGATRSVRVRAFCPVPQGGTDYRATARSNSFTGVVTLTQPPLSTPAASSTPVTTAAPSPEVHGFALVDEDARPGRYEVDVKCDGTNDTGKATFTLTAKRSEPAPTRTRVVPTRAPRAGGGGTAAGATDEPGGIPTAVTVVVLLGALGGGVALARHRSRTR